MDLSPPLCAHEHVVEFKEDKQLSVSVTCGAPCRDVGKQCRHSDAAPEPDMRDAADSAASADRRFGPSLLLLVYK